MSDPYVGEIRMFGGNFSPRDWAFCDGSLLSINQNTALYSLLGTTYGGDGQNTFGIPDLRGRVPVHQGTGGGLTPRSLGEVGGQQAVTLTTTQLPSHNHTMAVSTTPATQGSPANNVPAAVNPSTTNYSFYVESGMSGRVPAPMASGTLSPQGSSQPHENMMPFLAVSFIISLYGIYPTRN